MTTYPYKIFYDLYNNYCNTIEVLYIIFIQVEVRTTIPYVHMAL